jgi:Transposase DNA-binding/Transposase Tn5 dimerisation domain
MDEAEWAINEFGAADLGDTRRTDRLVALASALAQRPAASLPAACDDPAMLKGAYRWLENPAVAPEAVLASHVQATLERVQQVPLVLAVQDTTDLDYSHHPATQGLGPIGNGYGRGLLVHTTLAITPERLPLGLLGQQAWVRDAASVGKKHRRKQLPIGEKESQKWLTGLATVSALAAECPQTRFVSVGDAEADIYDVFCAPRPANVDFLVRAAYDRCVAPEAPDGRLVRARLARQPAGGPITIRVPRKGQQPARTAELAARWTTVALQPPANRTKDHLPPVVPWVIWVVELAPPDGVEPLDWLLWTTVPTPDQAAAEERLAWYACRWGIEVWHHVLKSGCALEARQLESLDALRRGLALYSVIAWRILYATLLARSAPDLPCSVLLEAAEWQALYCAIHKTPTPPATPPSLHQAVRWIAQLGGFIGRAGDGEPGAQVLWRGFQRLHDLTLMFHVFSPPPTRAKCG